MVKALVLGSGGREHAIGWALHTHRPDWSLLFGPGNGGTDGLGENVPLRADDPDAVLALVRDRGIDFVLVGPEAPLVAGVSDRLEGAGTPVFGPAARAAEIEGSKVFSKTLMRDHGIRTAAFEVYEDAEEAARAVQKGLFPKVVKADGLAAGKGAIVVETPSEGVEAVAQLSDRDRFGEAGRRLVFESFLRGEEASAFAICRDEEFLLLPLSQDHKRIGEGDTGPNTGGMGAYAPYPRTTPALWDRIGEEILRPTLRAMAGMGRPFRGLLYAGLMIDAGVPSVVEFNCRFGDPETQAVFPLVGPALIDALWWSATGEGDRNEIEARLGCAPAGPGAATAPGDRARGDSDGGEAPAGGEPGGPMAAATVVLASSGYPGTYTTGHPITGVKEADALPDTWVFHAGTKTKAGRLVTSGGRVLAVTGRGPDLRSALGRAYEGASLIEFHGRTFRRDIGHRGLSQIRGRRRTDP